MNKSFSTALAVVAVAGGATGCQTMADVVRAKQRGQGTIQIYPVTEQQAWDISRTVFRWEGTDAIEEHRDEGYMLTSTSVDLLTYGTVMGAWIEPVDPANTSVTVITKRKVATNLVTSLTESTYHRRFAEGVETIKSGKPLTLERPREGTVPPPGAY